MGPNGEGRCLVKYPGGVNVHFYHGFTQPACLDRQEFRLLFEKGDLTLESWVPTTLKIRAIADEKTTRAITERLGSGYRLNVTESYGGDGGRLCRGHGNVYDVYQRFDLQCCNPLEKSALYCELLRRSAADQIAWIRDREHSRRVTETNGRDSIAVAEAAQHLVASPG